MFKNGKMAIEGFSTGLEGSRASAVSAGADSFVIVGSGFVLLVVTSAEPSLIAACSSVVSWEGSTPSSLF